MTHVFARDFTVLCNLTQSSLNVDMDASIEVSGKKSCTIEEQCGSIESHASSVSDSIQDHGYSLVVHDSVSNKGMDNLNTGQYCSLNPWTL